jgi:tRNA uridine 5-carbamoylmethylation protein Kti12
MAQPLLICLVGLPRSGKSTLTKTLTKAFAAPVVNRDTIRLALHGQRYTHMAEPFVKAITKVMITSLFLSGHEFVIYDETNFSQAARDWCKSPDWDTIFVHLPTSLETCIERAHATGQPDLEPILKEMAARWEPFGPNDKVLTHDEVLSLR